jgi:hypothetical protein
MAAVLVFLSLVPAGCFHKPRTTNATTSAEPPQELQSACEDLSRDLKDLEEKSDHFKSDLKDFEDKWSDKMLELKNAKDDTHMVKRFFLRNYAIVVDSLRILMTSNRIVRDDLYRVSRARLHATQQWEAMKAALTESNSATKAIDDQFTNAASARDYVTDQMGALIDPEAKTPDTAPTGYEYADHKDPVETYQRMACKGMH